MTELQKIELDLLVNFIQVCEKLNLRWYLVCGTALGAVKYGGFIPWDDDVDVALPREDYEIFVEKSQSLLPDGIFLQNSKTDPAFPQLYSKLRNSNTTYIEKSVAHLRMNHGIYIDVFPLDGYPADKKEAKRLERKIHICRLKLSCAYNLDFSKKEKILYSVERILGYRKRTHKTIKKYNEIISAWPTGKSDIWCNHGNWQGRLEYAPREQYGEGKEVYFEGVKVRVPEKYDEYLTQKYGNWRADIPDEKKVGHHYYFVCDTDKPYTLYIKQGGER
ncbi:MAG: LicD family protein [Clostridia bacterium]|nr:LicD family protein [Clostridia bacterium]